MTARKPKQLTAWCCRGAACSLLLTVALLSGPSPTHAADDDTPLDSKILGGFMEALGLRKDGEGIVYQQRPPLVIPPDRGLPPPEKPGAAIAKNPAWPKDPDVERAKQEAAIERKQTRWAGDAILLDQSVLRPDQMTPGPKPRKVSRAANNTSNWSNDDPRLSPRELGDTGGFFSKMFGSKESDVAKFTGEPARTTLTEPPPGYQTPSPDQPYGLGAEASAPKATDYLQTHVEGSK